MLPGLFTSILSTKFNFLKSVKDKLTFLFDLRENIDNMCVCELLIDFAITIQFSPKGQLAKSASGVKLGFYIKWKLSEYQLRMLCR